MVNVLLLEDDTEFCAEISEYLSRYKIVVTFIHTMENFTEILLELKPDVLVLDQFVVGEDTLLALPDIRAIYSGGIVVYTGNLDSVDRIVALECGADDFISKQSAPREFVARLRAVLRRIKQTSTELDSVVGRDKALVSTSGTEQWVFDTTRGSIQTPSGSVLRLTSTEFEFLVYAEKRAGELMTRDQMSVDIFQRKYTQFDRAIDNMLSRIRKLLDPHLNGDSAFRSVRGRGYVFIGLNREDQIDNAAAAAGANDVGHMARNIEDAHLTHNLSAAL